MSIEYDDNYHIWKIKLQLAQQGSIQALQQIKNHCIQQKSTFSHIENNFHDALNQSQIKYIKQNQTYGDYQLYSDVPIFLLLQGEIQFKCLNLQGDQQILQTYKQQGIISINKQKISQKFGQSNVNIVTKFHLTAITRSIIIEINSQSKKKIQNQTSNKSIQTKVGLRQEAIMKKYMMFPLKYIRIEDYQIKLPIYEEKFYLLEGRVCYYYHKGKQRYLIAVYQEGYINPKQFENTDFKLYLFTGAKVLIFQEEFLKDDVTKGVQLKKAEHFKMIQAKLQKMTTQERRKILIKLINNFKLEKKIVQKQILGIVQKEQRPLALTQKTENLKRISTTKNDLISTSSSIKQKCRIRISKKSSRKAV